MAYARLLFDYKEEVTDIEDWDMNAIIKSNYESVDVQNNELPNLHQVEDFTYENFLNDISIIQTRGINQAQFIAEACIVFIRKEKSIV